MVFPAQRDEDPQEGRGGVSVMIYGYVPGIPVADAVMEAIDVWIQLGPSPDVAPCAMRSCFGDFYLLKVTILEVLS